MKLYVFDSCPFCVRSRMLIGLKGIDCELKFLIADDVETPTRMIGKKRVPILEKDDETFLGESWEINRYLDGLDGKPLIGEFGGSSGFEEWYKTYNSEYDLLCYPRMPYMGLPELGSEGAMSYFRSSRYEVLGMSLEDAIAQTDTIKPRIEQKLSEIAGQINEGAAIGGPLTADDFYLFPLLRGLTMVKGLQFPPPLMDYMVAVSERIKVPLYLDRAV